MSTLKDQWDEAQIRFFKDFQEILKEIVKKQPISKEDFFIAVSGSTNHIYGKQNRIAELAMTTQVNASRWINGLNSPGALTREAVIKGIINDIDTKINEIKNAPTAP